jgi:DNA polymerase III delta subunit
MITLLHGDDIVKSRNELFALRESFKGQEIREINGKSIDEALLIQSLSSNSLFGEKVVVIIENLCTGMGKKTKRLEELLAIIKQEEKNAQIILWEEKEVGKTAATALGSSTNVRLFKLPTIIFQFLDGVHPRNLSGSLLLLNQILVDEPEELVHAMLLKRIRQLLFLQSGIVPDSLQSWQVGRLTNQLKFFTLKGLISLYHDMVRAEYQIKSGASSTSLTEQIQRYLLLNL